MKLIDYSGKLNNHNKYLEIIKKLEIKTQYIEYVLIDENDIDFINKFKNNIISIKLKNMWWGTRTSKRYKIYTIKATNEVFKYLKQYETFCKYTVLDEDIVDITDFGTNDIAFFDNQELPLLFTTTHEGYITIRNDLIL